MPYKSIQRVYEILKMSQYPEKFRLNVKNVVFVWYCENEADNICSSLDIGVNTTILYVNIIICLRKTRM